MPETTTYGAVRLGRNEAVRVRNVIDRLTVEAVTSDDGEVSHKGGCPECRGDWYPGEGEPDAPQFTHAPDCELGIVLGWLPL